MAQEWWILRDNEMSDRTYTRNELLRLEDFGPDTKVCRTNSNSWVRARRDPALSTLFDDGGRGSRETTAASGSNGKIRFVPRYFRLLAAAVDLGILASFLVVLDLITFTLDFTQSTLFLIGFCSGAVFYTLAESNFLTFQSPGKQLFGLDVVHLDDAKTGPIESFGRYCLVGVPILLLGVAFDPSLPHDTMSRVTSLVFGSLGVSWFLVNVYLFFFNNPTYRLLHDYVFATWVLPRSTELVPRAGLLRRGQLVVIGVITLVGIGLAGGLWRGFWSVKEPPLVRVPETCEINPELRLVDAGLNVNRSRYRQLLLDRDYSALQSRLKSLFERYRSGEINDVPLSQAMSVFYVLNPVVGRRINEWVIDNPDSPYALLARAQYHRRRGEVFGRLQASVSPDTPVNTTTENSLEQARLSAQKALEINNEISLSYSVLIGIDKIKGNDHRDPAVPKRGRKLDPPSVSVWLEETLSSNYRVTMTLDTLRSRLRELNPSRGSSSSLNLFCGLAAQKIADRYHDAGRFWIAEKYYRQALRYGQAPWVYFRRGVNAIKMGRTPIADDYFRRALAELPHRTRVLRKQARLHFDKGAFSRALDPLNRALEREPVHPRVLYLYARVLNRIGKTERALNQLELVQRTIPGWTAVKKLQSRIRGGEGQG